MFCYAVAALPTKPLYTLYSNIVLHLKKAGPQPKRRNKCCYVFHGDSILIYNSAAKHFSVIRNLLAPDPVTMKTISWKFPRTLTSSVVIGDSQVRHVHNHFDASRHGTPAFVSQRGATIQDIPTLMDFVPRTATTIVLHVGTNDIAKTSATLAFQRYENLLSSLRRDHPQIRLVYATLILPRCPDRRRQRSNWRDVHRFNTEACRFNDLLRRHCLRTRGLFYLDHGLEWLPSARVFAADGIHPSFDGVAIMAGHLHRTLLRNFARRHSTWLLHAASGLSEQLQGQSPPPPPSPPTVAALAAVAPSTRPLFSDVVRESRRD